MKKFFGIINCIILMLVIAVGVVIFIIKRG